MYMAHHIALWSHVCIYSPLTKHMRWQRKCGSIVNQSTRTAFIREQHFVSKSTNWQCDVIGHNIKELLRRCCMDKVTLNLNMLSSIVKELKTILIVYMLEKRRISIFIVILNRDFGPLGKSWMAVSLILVPCLYFRGWSYFIDGWKLKILHRPCTCWTFVGENFNFDIKPRRFDFSF